MPFPSGQRSSIEARSLRPYLAIVIVGLIALLAGLIFAIDYGSMWFFSHYFEHSQAIPGDATRVDPVRVFPQVQAYAGVGARLVSVEARSVHMDGTLNLMETYVPSPSVNYVFVADAVSDKKSPPPGVLSQENDRTKQKVTIVLSRPGEIRYVTRTSASGRSRYNYVNYGMKREEFGAGTASSLETAGIPTCLFTDLWKVALQKKTDLSPQTVASITYAANEYHFEIPGTDVDLLFSANCRLKEGP